MYDPGCVVRKMHGFLLTQKERMGPRSDECARIRSTSLPMSRPINTPKTGSLGGKELWAKLNPR